MSDPRDGAAHPRARYDVRDESDPDLIDLRQVDAEPDVGLVADYASSELSAEEAALVERRLEEDPEFREFAIPIIVAWRAPIKLPVPKRPREEMQASWAAFVRQARETDPDVFRGLEQLSDPDE